MFLLCLAGLLVNTGCRSPDYFEASTKSLDPVVLTKPSTLVEDADGLAALDALHRAAYQAIVRAPGIVHDARGGERLLSVTMPGEEIPLDLKTGISRNSQYMWKLEDSVPHRSHLYSRHEWTVFETIQQIYSDGFPDPGYSQTGARYTERAIRKAKRELFESAPFSSVGNPRITKQHAAYRKYQRQYAAAADTLAQAASQNSGVAQAQAALEQARIDWEKFGHRQDIEKALEIYSGRSSDEFGPWLVKKNQLGQSGRAYAIGDFVPFIDLVPRYEEWRGDSGWVSVQLSDANGKIFGSVAIRSVALHRTWLDWKILRSDIWSWKESVLKPNRQVADGRAFGKTEDTLMPLIPISLIVARDVVITNQDKGFSFEDRSRDHVRLIGVVSGVVPACPEDGLRHILREALRRAMQNTP